MNVSPGIYTKIIDLSAYVQNVPSTIGFLPIICEKGQDNTLIMTSLETFYRDFGNPNLSYAGKSYSQGPYVASQFLTQSSALYVVRCLPVDAAWSCLAITFASDATVPATDATVTLTATSVADVSTITGLNAIIGLDEPVLIPATGEKYVDATVAVIYGIGRGEWYNNFGINMTPFANNPEEYLLQIEQKQKETDQDGNPLFEPIESYTVSFNPEAVDSSGDSMFIADVINTYSVYLRCLGNEDICRTQINALYRAINAGDGTLTAEPLTFQALANGSSGSLFDSTTGLADASVATQVLVNCLSGNLMQTDGELLLDVINPEEEYFSLVFDAGYPAEVKSEIVNLTKLKRQDSFSVLDNGDNISVAASIAARTAIKGETFGINSYYSGIYEPYTKIYDQWQGRDVWISPTFHMARVIPYTDNVADLWWAPAGFSRASITGVKQMRFNPNLPQRDKMYLAQLNPIVKFRDGIVVWSQLTAQTKASKMSDVNVVRMVLYCKRAIANFCKNYVFEFNDSATWDDIQTEVSSFLTTVQNSRGLRGFSVNVGASEYQLKAKQCAVDIILEPMTVMEQILLNFYIT